jgi:hypothetical protein
VREPTRAKIYELIGEFLDALNADDVEHLFEKFGLSSQILGEIHEVLDAGLRHPNPKLGLAPYEQAFTRGSGSRPSIELFGMNDAGSWGVECSLWIDGRESDFILHAVVREGAEGLALNYGYIGS